MNMIPDSYGRFTLKPVQSRGKKFSTIVLMAIVWNALTGVAIWAVVTQWKGGMMYLVAVVLFIFALLGIIMIWSILYQFISLFGPRVTLTTGSNNLRFGGILDLNWSFTMPQLIKKLEFWLELDDDEKDAVCIYRATDNFMAARGQASIQLPEKRAFKRNYTLSLKAAVKYFPNVDQDYFLEIAD
jgi:hypothetical protein